MGSPPHRTHFRPPDEGGHGVAERLRWHQGEGDALALGQLGEWVALALLVDQCATSSGSITQSPLATRRTSLANVARSETRSAVPGSRRRSCASDAGRRRGAVQGGDGPRPDRRRLWTVRRPFSVASRSRRPCGPLPRWPSAPPTGERRGDETAVDVGHADAAAEPSDHEHGAHEAQRAGRNVRRERWRRSRRARGRSSSSAPPSVSAS